MHVKSSASFVRSVAAGAAVARARHGRRGRLHAQVPERAVQLAADLMEQLLARDQIVCGDSAVHYAVSINISLHEHAGGYSLPSICVFFSFFFKLTIPSAMFLIFFIFTITSNTLKYVI